MRGALRWFVAGPHRRTLALAFVRRLEACRAALEASAWFGRHEVVSSSILFVWDEACQDAAAPGAAPAGHGASTWMIDFAKTRELTPPAGGDGAAVTHRAKWVDGNHEDGYLFGLDTLIAMWREIADAAEDAADAAEAEIEAEEAEMEADVAAAPPSAPANGNAHRAARLRAVRASVAALAASKRDQAQNDEQRALRDRLIAEWGQ